MKRLVLSGWKVGFNKMGLTKLLRGTLGLPLSKAKRITDTVLKNEQVVIEVPDERFEAIVVELNDLGVKFVASDHPKNHP